MSLLDKPINQGYSVLYEGETISGMSGSPSLNGEGNLVGIHGIYRVDDPQIRKGSSYAIPINTYKELVAEESEPTDTFGSIKSFKPQQPVWGYEAAATLWQFGSSGFPYTSSKPETAINPPE